MRRALKTILKIKTTRRATKQVMNVRRNNQNNKAGTSTRNRRTFTLSKPKVSVALKPSKSISLRAVECIEIGVCNATTEPPTEAPPNNTVEFDGKIINWWRFLDYDGVRLVPIKIIDDGNSLCHAVSMGLLGHQDQNLHYRKLIHLNMQMGELNGLWKAWKADQKITNDKLNIDWSEKQFKDEWKAIVKRAALVLVNGAFSHLEKIHIYALANIIGRTIIVYTKTMIEDVPGLPLQQSDIGGIYPPLLIPSHKFTGKNPILLKFDQNHFETLLIDHDKGFLLPLTRDGSKSKGHLPVHFNEDMMLNPRNGLLVVLHFNFFSLLNHYYQP